MGSMISTNTKGGKDDFAIIGTSKPLVSHHHHPQDLNGNSAPEEVANDEDANAVVNENPEAVSEEIRRLERDAMEKKDGTQKKKEAHKKSRLGGGYVFKKHQKKILSKKFKNLGDKSLDELSYISKNALRSRALALDSEGRPIKKLVGGGGIVLKEGNPRLEVVAAPMVNNRGNNNDEKNGGSEGDSDDDGGSEGDSNNRGNNNGEQNDVSEGSSGDSLRAQIESIGDINSDFESGDSGIIIRISPRGNESGRDTNSHTEMSPSSDGAGTSVSQSVRRLDEEERSDD